ncbi:MAG: NlpC/P60 family protein [Labilithrix sp.]|nr:NlpC/P60 family protein [Labilithrix sp.]
MTIMTTRFTFRSALVVLTLAIAACVAPTDDDGEGFEGEGDPDIADTEEAVTSSTTEALTSSQKTKLRDEVIGHGDNHLRAPYKFGATTDTTSEFDCSSFVKHVYSTTAGITLPRTSRQQATRGALVPLGSLRKGDLVFFKASSKTSDTTVRHVAIYAGDDRLLHTYRVGVGVTFTPYSGYWRERAVVARDVIGR